jgi:mono/diheme cytochrome c family protein
MKPAIVALLLACAMLLAISQLSANTASVTNGFNAFQFHLGADTYSELRKAPEKAVNRANPLENDPEAVAAGKLLFEDHCAECHGDDAKGGRKAPSLRVSEVQNATPGTLFWLLTNGVVRKKMPAWSKLPEPQRWQLVRFLKSSEATPIAATNRAAKP